MTAELDNLVKSHVLKAEPASRTEFDSLVGTGKERLTYAKDKRLPNAIRFDLAYDAGFAFSLAAMRRKGYRPSKNARYAVFQTLPHTLGTDLATCRVLSKSHDKRNLAEYEGVTEVDSRLLMDLIEAVGRLEASVRKLDPPKQQK